MPSREYFEFYGQRSVLKMILNPGDYQGSRLDSAVELLQSEVKLPVRANCLELKEIIPLEIKHTTEDDELEKLCKALGLKLVHPKDLISFYKKILALPISRFTPTEKTKVGIILEYGMPQLLKLTIMDIR